nr:reverse transcriptase domain-containing protein [Clostridium chromiireducens]
MLSNIVLNELDWWISSQWETFETEHQYKLWNKYRALKETNLKEIYLVRYADDFKIFCRDYKTAHKIYNATRLWLHERLDLEVSPDKSKITNLRKNYTDFLGFKLTVKPKKGKYVCQSRISDKSKEKIIKDFKNQIKRIQKSSVNQEVSRLNSMIIGWHNYYNAATYVSSDFSKIDFLVTKTMDIRLKNWISNKPKYSETYKKLYGAYNGKIRTIRNITIFPIYACKNRVAMNFTQEICNYTEKGRMLIHNKLRGYNHLIRYLLKNGQGNQTTEFNDNRISLIVGQRGKCYVTGYDLETDNMECHHKKQKCDGGSDEYKNLVWLCEEAHKLVHCTKGETIDKYLGFLNLDEQGLKRVNSLRKLVGNSVI